MDLSSSEVAALNNLKFEFETNTSGGVSTNHDQIVLVIDSLTDIVAYPTCSVDYLRGINGNSNNVNLTENKYFTTAGDYAVYGYNAEGHAACSIIREEFNRTSPAYTILSWDAAGNAAYMNFDWKTHSSSDNTEYEEGNHTVCCHVVSQADCSTGQCGQQFEGENCTTFCIDSTPINVNSASDNFTSDCGGIERYTNNSGVEYSWSVDMGTGCAGLDYYNVTVYDMSTGLVVNSTRTSNANLVFNLAEGNYSVVVFAVDLAGNVGTSAQSENIVVDLTNPVVTQTGGNWNVWYNDDFNVTETDWDNFGLASVKYYVDATGMGTVVPLTTISENETVTVLVPEQCNVSGANDCRVTKVVQDYSCRMDSEQRQYDIDLDEPNTTKTVSTPKFAPWGSWISKLTNGWFVTKDTVFTLTCNDSYQGSILSGCHKTFYNVTNTDTGAVVYNTTNGTSPLSFSLPDVDGNYTITYWSTDEVGNVEVAQYEVDKLDNIAPNTTKTYEGAQVWAWRYMPTFSNLQTWMRYIAGGNDPVNITLAAADTQVGVNKTYYQILKPRNMSTGGDIIDTEWYCYYNTSMHNGTWHENQSNIPEDDSLSCNQTNWTYEDNYMFNVSLCQDNVTIGGSSWCNYTGPVQVIQECDHKIRYFSMDHLNNTEEIKAQVFSVDSTEPMVFIVDPTGSEKQVEYCSIPVDIEIDDMKVGLDDSAVYAEVLNGTGYMVSGPHYLARDSSYDGKGTAFNGDKFYLPNNLDLDSLPAGNYTLNIYASDLLANGGLINSTNITLLDGIYARLTNGCSVGSNGGLCTLQYTACVRNATDMGFNMSKIFPENGGNPIADLSTLEATFYTNGGSGAVAQINYQTGAVEFNGDVLPFLNESCGVVNGRTKFNVTLNFTEDLVDKIGSGNYQFNWTTEAFLNQSC